MNYRHILSKGSLILKKNRIIKYNYEAEFLLCYALNKSRENILLNLEQEVNLIT